MSQATTSSFPKVICFFVLSRSSSKLTRFSKCEFLSDLSYLLIVLQNAQNHKINYFLKNSLIAFIFPCIPVINNMFIWQKYKKILARLVKVGGKNIKKRSKLPKKWTNMLKYSLCNVQRLCDYHFVFVYSKFGFYVQISAYFKSHHKFHGYFVKTTGFIRGSRSIGGA